MKKILWIVSLLAGSGVFGAQGAAALLKGEVKTYDMDGFRLHVYLTQDALGDATTAVEGRDGLVILEMPLFKENLKEFAGYLKGLGKPVVKVVADYHVGGVADYAPDQVVLVEGMSEFAKGAVYGGMLEGFKAAFGDAIDLREHAGHEEVPAEGRRIWAGVAFDFSRGASSDFPASSVVIGGRVCYTHFAPAKAHLSPLQITGPEAVDAQLAALKAAAASGCTLFVGGHGAPATPAEVEFQIAYLEKLKSLVAENADAGALAAALSAAWPGLPGDPAALAAVLYR